MYQTDFILCFVDEFPDYKNDTIMIMVNKGKKAIHNSPECFHVELNMNLFGPLIILLFEFIQVMTVYNFIWKIVPLVYYSVRKIVVH